MSFKQLGLQPLLQQTLQQLGYQQPTPIQQRAIPVILQGKDVMAGAQTGTGKTAAFALPIIHKLLAEPEDSLACLVLTPTRELAQQVFQSFEQYSEGTQLRSVVAYGGVSLVPQQQALAQGANILIATPGRLLDLLSKKALSLSQLQYLVFDEADRMLDMGFKDEIQKLLRKVPEQRQTLLFSATFDDGVFNLSKTLLKQPKLIEVDTRNKAACKVEQQVYQVDEERKRELTSFMIGSKNWQQVLIFTRTKQTADELAKEMNKDGIKASAIHGDKSQGAREKALEDFKTGQIRALVATDVAARGLDIEQLQYVINYELPYVAEDYIHRIGRTGRAGATGLAVSLLSVDENWLLEEIEAVLDERLPQLWYPGYEPDLTRVAKDSNKNSRGAQKRRAKQRGRGKKTGNKRC